MRVYSASFENVTVSAVQDLFDIAPADDRPVEILSIVITQSSEVGDAAEEMLRLRFVRGFATAGSGGTAPTAEPHSSTDSGTGATVRVNDTSQAVVGAGTTNILRAETFNVRAGYYYTPIPEERIIVKQPDTRLVVQLMAAPTDAVSMSGTITFRELS
jgi:hypothetical protein